MPSREIAIVGPRGAGETRALLREVRGRFLSGTVLAYLDPAAPDAEASALAKLIPLLEGKSAAGGRVTAYVCENYASRAPAADVAALAAQLR